MITDKQSDVLIFLNEFYLDNFYPPSVQEVANEFDVVCNTVQGHIDALEKKGFVTRKAGKARSVVLTRAGRTHCKNLTS